MTERYELGKPAGKERLLAALGDQPPRLDLAALAIATVGDKDLDERTSLDQLEVLAEKVKAHGGEPEAALAAVLGEEDFRGDPDNYDAPENSMLPLVLKTKRGLPILLSTVWMEVGRRAGIEVVGIGLPGHFVIGFEHEDGLQLRDPYSGGKVLTFADCADIVRKNAGGATLHPRMLEPVETAPIAWRMLNNLKSSYATRNDDSHTLEVLDLMLTLAPEHPLQLLHRAELLTGLGAFSAALKDIEKCKTLESFPDPSRLEKIAAQLKERIGELH